MRNWNMASGVASLGTGRVNGISLDPEGATARVGAAFNCISGWTPPFFPTFFLNKKDHGFFGVSFAGIQKFSLPRCCSEGFNFKSLL